MFDIEYKGANAVVFTTKKTQLVFDPRVSVAGGKDVFVKGDKEHFSAYQLDMKIVSDYSDFEGFRCQKMPEFVHHDKKTY